jgi:4-amino-4-deoxy-L-arabinose transferase-like glycosyltransferase
LKAFVSPPALLLWLCLGLYLPGLASLPPVDRDEARFAQATRQMLESGNFIEPRFRDAGRYKKPIGIYWLQAAAVTFVGAPGSISAYRLPSLLGAILAVLGTYAIGGRLFGRSVGFLAGALLACSALTIVEAMLATTDATLLAAIVAAQSCLAIVLLTRLRGERASARVALGFWAALACGILLKGPVAPAVALLTIATLRWRWREHPSFRGRWWGDLHIGPGLLLLTAIIAPWAVAVGVDTDWRFFADALHRDILPKLLRGQESHGAPPGYYLVLSPATLWPGSLVALSGLYAAVRDRREPAVMFCLAWLAPAWLLFELLPTKLPHYVLPTYPALAILGARALVGDVPELRARPGRIGLVLWIGVGTLFLTASLLAPVVLSGRANAFSLAPACATLATVVVVVRSWRSGRFERAAWVALLGGGLALASVFGGLLPRIPSLWPSQRIAEAVAAPAPPGSGRPVAVVGYEEPSLVFLLGNEVATLGPAEAARFLAEHEDALVWVREDLRGTVDAASGVPLHAIAVVDGWNISKGRRLRLILLARRCAITMARGCARRGAISSKNLPVWPPTTPTTRKSPTSPSEKNARRGI